MIEMDTKKKADVDLASRLAGFANAAAAGETELYHDEDSQDNQPKPEEDANTLLTQIVTEVEDQKFEDTLYLEMASEMERKHKAVSADRYDDDEDGEIQDQAMSYVEFVPKHQRDSVDEEFSKIQDEDMQNEKTQDRRQQVLAAQREHDAFMRRLDKKGMSAVTHDEDDKTTLDVISDSIMNKQKQQKMSHKKKVKIAEPRVISEAEQEAESLSESLNQHRLFENHQLQSASEVNVEAQTEESMSRMQAEIEARVQKDLEQLSIIANNKYAGGKRVYDYQLVRLSDGQKKLEEEALQQADQLQYKHSALKQKEEDLNGKFQLAEKTLNEYKTKFYKDKSRLQQDHDSFVKIKEQTEKDLKEQITIQ